MATEAAITTLRHVWETLQPLNVPKALMGGIALAFWKHPRFTKDVDILVSIDPVNVPEVIAHLAKAGILSKRPDPLIKLEDVQFLQLFYEPPESFIEVQVDLLLGQSEYQRQAIARRVPIPSSMAGFELDVLTCEDLIIHKLLAGRLIDLADAAYLLRRNRPGLDFAYLRKWIAEKQLKNEFAQVWDEAFANEPLPFTT